MNLTDKNVKPKLIGETSKTGVSFGLPIGNIKDGGSCLMCNMSEICKKCYGRKGHYQYSSVKNCHARRLESSKLDSFVLRMAFEISSLLPNYDDKNLYFRIHDTGDFYSVEYIEKWISIVKSIEEIRKFFEIKSKVLFWVPTKIWYLPQMLDSLKKLNSFENVSVRPSAMNINDSAPKVDGLSCGTSTVLKVEESNCPAIIGSLRNKSLKNGETTYPSSCETCNCRRCWNKEEEVLYALH
jgi:hypothetical protein